MLRRVRHMRRLVSPKTILLLLGLTLGTYLYSLFHNDSTIFDPSTYYTNKNVSYVFYNKLFDAIAQFKPLEPPEKNRELQDTFKCKKTGNYGLNDAKKFTHLNTFNLNHCYQLSEEQKTNLHDMHYGYVSFLKTQFNDDMIENLLSVTSNKGSKKDGIVTVGGGRYSVLLTTMLETLRHSGTTLPVEVFIPPVDEGDDEFCSMIKEKYDAQCVYFKDILPQNIINEIEVKSYQIKAMALVLSHFENILFLDADNFAMKNLNHVFESEIYKETGLVIWPDLWRRFTAPAYYDIAEIPVNLSQRVRYSYDDVLPVSQYTEDLNADFTTEDTNVPFHDLKGTIADPASESGQMMINKRKHFHTLLLALYYNIYGPKWYYNMFSQGTAGEGDKETFISAAHALKIPYYQVRTPLGFDGFHHDVKAYQGLGLMQHDFDQDYKWHLELLKKVHDNIDEYSKFNPKYDVDNTYKREMLQKTGSTKSDMVDVMFLHASFYKFDPWSLYDQDCFKTSKGEHIRGYTNQRRYGGFDFELFNFKALQDKLCNKSPAHRYRNFKYLNDKIDSEEKWDDVCRYINDHVKYLKQTPLSSSQ